MPIDKPTKATPDPVYQIGNKQRCLTNARNLNELGSPKSARQLHRIVFRSSLQGSLRCVYQSLCQNDARFVALCIYITRSLDTQNI